MSIKRITPFALALLLGLSACNGGESSNPSSGSDSTTSPTTTNVDPSTDPSTEPTPTGDYKAKFDELVNSIKTNHNYRLEVHSYLPEYEDDPDTIYDDYFVNLNDKAYYNKFYSGVSGIIYQKNQGYINFIYAGSNVIDNGFYATNPNVGISSIYDLVAENLFLGTYIQDSANKAIFRSANTDSIAVGCNFTGYVNSSNFVAPEYLEIEVKPNLNQLVMTVNFTCWFIEDGVGKQTSGISTLTIKDIGETRNLALESYIANPTNVFVAPTAWSDDDKALLDQYFASKYVTFPVEASYAFSTSEYLDKRDGSYKVLLTDYGSGDLSTSFGNVLVSTEGFTYSNGLYTLAVEDNVNFKITTYTIEMSYLGPNEAYYGRTVGYFYPNGIYQALFKAKTTNKTINSVASFNEYIHQNEYDNAIPLLNFTHVTNVTGFTDKTMDKNAAEGAGTYIFHSGSSYIKFYVENYSDAIADINAYVAALEAEGYDSTSPFFSYINHSNDNDFKSPSYVSITNAESITSSNYSGYFEMRFQIYAFKDEEDIPVLTKIEITKASTNHFTVGDDFVFDGEVYATYSKGQYVKVDNSHLTFTGYDMSVSGTQTVVVSFKDGDVTKSASYEIYVASNNVYSCTFYMYGENITISLNLSDDGTGTYTLSRPSTGTFVIDISYVISGSSITFHCESEYQTSDFTRFSLFAISLEGGDYRTGTISGDSITVTISTATGTQELEKTLTK